MQEVVMHPLRYKPLVKNEFSVWVITRNENSFLTDC